MAKALFFNVPAHGHITPSLPLVGELVRRGHTVAYFATQRFRTGIEAAGAAFRAYASIPDDYFEADGLSGKAPQRAIHALMTSTQAVLPELLETARRDQPDVVLFDGMCPWGYYVARILGVPAVTSLALMPLITPPIRAILRPFMLRVIASALFTDFDKGVASNRISRALGKQYGVAPLGSTSLMNAIGDIALSYTSRYFQPWADRAPDALRFIGWTPMENAADDGASFRRADGRRLIYASLGTVNNDDSAFFRACIDAFADGEHDLLISTGNGIRPDFFGALPSNIMIRSWVPQVAVLKQAALFITHGGMNSIHDGLYFGVPLLLVPQQGEQTVNAMRVAELGAGIVLDKARVTAETVKTQTDRLLSASGFKAEARRIGDSFRASGGVSKGADEVEALLARRRAAA